MDENALDRTLDLITAYNSAARSEISQRVGIRTTIISLFLGAAGVIAGVAFVGPESVSQDRSPILFLIPLLGLGATFEFLQHDQVINALGRYVAIELHPLARTILIDRGVESDRVPAEFGNSRAREFLNSGRFAHRFLSSFVLLLLPQVLAGVLAMILLGWNRWSIAGGVLTGACVGLSTAALTSVHRRRRLSDVQTFSQGSGQGHA